MYKLLTYLIILITSTGCSLKQHTLVEGESFNNLEIGTTKESDITKKYGWRKNNYGIAPGTFMNYEGKKISFGVTSETTNGVLHLIGFKPKRYRTKTFDGLKLNNNTTINDIITVYGTPSYRYADGINIERYDNGYLYSVEFIIDYPKKGIMFLIEPEAIYKNQDSHLLDDSTLIAKTVGVDSIYFQQRISYVYIYSDSLRKSVGKTIRVYN
ncbi:MAG: hypothetical protein COB15_01650 [Flavobacteriales bacterium]|nr:MAG: hypothetical protein COB15_01650 [Flavobacteriales bacterium]